MKRRAAMLVLLLAAAGACAHDTWLERHAGGGELRMGTGDHFPRQDFPVRAANLQAAGCVDAQGAALPLQVLGGTPTALRLRPADAAAMCWAHTRGFEIMLDHRLAEAHLKDIGANAALREAWRALRTRGIGWKETYTKYARIELGGVPAVAVAPMAFDARIEPDSGSPPVVGATLRIVLLRDGQPLPGLALELRNERAPRGLWLRTDAQGRLDWQPPLAGHWLLRTVDLRPVADAPERWDSRFLTLRFEVAAR